MRLLQPFLPVLVVLVLARSTPAQDPLQPPLGETGWIPPAVADVRFPDSLAHLDQSGGCVQQLQVLEGVAGGGFVAAWRDLRDGLLGIYVARYDSELKAREPERPMYAPHTARRTDPSVFLYPDASGGIAWTSARALGSAVWLRVWDPEGAWYSPIEHLVADPDATPREERSGDLDRRRPLVFPIDAEHMGVVWTLGARVQYSLRNKRGDGLAEALDLARDATEAGLAAAAAPDGTLLVAWTAKGATHAAMGPKSGPFETLDLGQGEPRALRADPEGGWALLVQDGDEAKLRLCDARGRVQRETALARSQAAGLAYCDGTWCALLDGTQPPAPRARGGRATPRPGEGRGGRGAEPRRGDGPGPARGRATDEEPPSGGGALSSALDGRLLSNRLDGAPAAMLAAAAVAQGPGARGPGGAAPGPAAGRAGAKPAQQDASRGVAGAGAQALDSVRLLRIARDGSFVGEPCAPLPATAVQASAPRIASDGARLLFAWTDARAGHSDVWARLLEPGAEGGWTPGDERRLNTDEASSDQLHPCLAVAGDKALVVWSDRRGGAGRIYARRVGAAGLVGDELRLPLGRGPQPSGSCDRPHVAMAEDGSALVVWRERDDEAVRLRCQVLDLDGQPLAPVEELATGDAAGALEPPLALALKSGGWAVAWTAGKKGTQLRRLSRSGVPQTIAMRASEEGGSTQDANLVRLSDGRVLVGWTRHLGEAEQEGWSLRLRVYGPALDRQGDEFGLEPSRRNNDWDPSLAPGPDGGFAVAWCSGYPSQPDRDVCVRAYDGQAQPRGPILTPCHLGFEQDFPEIVRLADGSWAVAWEDDASGLDQTFVRRLLADGRGMGPTRLLNELPTKFVGDRVNPRLAAYGNGFLAAFGDRRRSLGLDALVKSVGPAFDGD